MRTADGYIISKCLNGNPAAFGLLVDKYKASVYALAYSELQNFHDAEDVTQEVFIKAFEKMRTLRQYDSFHAWLYSITFNTCKNLIRTRSRRPDREFIEDQDSEILEESSVDRYREETIYESVRESLASLPRDYRQVLSLYYLGGMNSVEIAEFLGINPTAVRHRLSRARAQLKEEMLDMMSETFEQQRLKATFTFRIVEAVKRTNINPMPKIVCLPWSLSLATGLLITILSFNPNLSLLDHVGSSSGSSSSGETKVLSVGEFPVDVLNTAEMVVISDQKESGNGGGKPGLPGPQKAPLVTASDGAEFVRAWPEEMLGLSNPQGAAVDSSGRIYVADSSNHRIQVFDPDGNPLKKWGNYGSGDGQFYFPKGIAFDGSGKIYVTDYLNNRIQIFDSDSNFLRKWGTKGTGDGQFNCPWGIAVDGSGNVYVTDELNHRIQKFDSDGNFVMKWGTKGSDNGQFDRTKGIAIDNSGNVYVNDANNNRIQMFDPKGNFLRKWGTEGDGNGQFNYPIGIAVDNLGHVYVADPNGRIQKFDSNGNFLKAWKVFAEGNYSAWPRGITVDGSGNVYVTDVSCNNVHKFDSDGMFLKKWGKVDINVNGQFDWLYDVAVDSSGNVYAVDQNNHRIQKFDSRGNFLTKWGSFGRGDGQFTYPLGIAVDSSEGVYVVDTPEAPNTHRIQKFDLDGKFLTKWGSFGRGDGQLGGPRALAVNKSGDIYVTERYNRRVQVFDSKGRFIMKWGTEGTGDGQFSGSGYGPEGIAVDRSGNVYVADTDNDRVQKFDSNGEFLIKWGTEGTGDGQFNYPLGIAVDGSGRVYVADTGNNRIQVFDSQGNFLTKWGTLGAGEMEFMYPSGIAINNSGEIYVADWQNNRIKVYHLIGGGAVEPGGKQLGKWGEVKRTELLQNFPNPFNPETWIPFSLSEPERVTIRIYGSTGQLVRTLDLGRMLSGEYLSKEKAAYWDGRNEAGEMVASDVYFCVMEAGESVGSRKMAMVR